MSTATRRRSSLLKGLDDSSKAGLRRRGSSFSAAVGERSGLDGSQQQRRLSQSSSSSQQAQQPPPMDPVTRKTHEQLAQCRANFMQRMQASLEEATAIGGRADVLVHHQRAQVRMWML